MRAIRVFGCVKGIIPKGLWCSMKGIDKHQHSHHKPTCILVFGYSRCIETDIKVH